MAHIIKTSNQMNGRHQNHGSSWIPLFWQIEILSIKPRVNGCINSMCMYIYICLWAVSFATSVESRIPSCSIHFGMAFQKGWAVTCCHLLLPHVLHININLKWSFVVIPHQLTSCSLFKSIFLPFPVPPTHPGAGPVGGARVPAPRSPRPTSPRRRRRRGS